MTLRVDLRVDPRFVGYILARGLSYVGDNVWLIAVGWSAAQLGDPRLTGIVLAATGIPRAAFMLVGGVVADLRGPRRFMLAADVLAGLTALIGAGLTAGGEPPTAWLLIALGLAFGTIDAFYLPAANSYLAALLPHAELPRGAAVRQFTRSISEALGRGAGGILVALGGFALAAFVNGATFLLCFAILMFVRPRFTIVRPKRDTGVRQALTDGLRYVVGHPLIRGLAVITLILNMVAIPVETIGVVLKAQDAGWGPSGYGLVAGFLAGGLIVGGLLGAVAQPPKRAGFALGLWIIAGLPGFAGLIFATDVWTVCAAAAWWSFCLGPCNAILSGLLLTETRPDVLGRVQSVVTVVSSAMTPLGIAAFGAFVGVVGLGPVGVACFGCVAATTGWMLLSPAISRAEVHDHSDGPGHAPAAMSSSD
ncbi:MFS transporter [Actinopolymorpha sp. B9G3]|uniref:MFS transporter n=1 Tax=Actinopolymorpha sp. B9G3 TaxID=3158970 RepID=UPI0032D97246